MPFNGVLLASTAKKSADLWQQAACLPEQISSDEMVDLVLCFPLQQLGRWALYFWTYLCFSPYHHHYAASFSDEDSDDDGASLSASNDYRYYGYTNQNIRSYDSSTHSD